MLRAIGAGLVGLSAALMGASLSGQMKKRSKAVRDFRDALICMQQKITYYRTPLPQMMCELSEVTQGSLSGFFAGAAVRLEENRDRTAEAVLKRCLREADYVGLPEEAREHCDRLLGSLGWMDGANQAEAIVRAVHEFDELDGRLREELQRRGRCFLALWICGGFAAAIILV